jgi:hypothetical protein
MKKFNKSVFNVMATAALLTSAVAPVVAGANTSFAAGTGTLSTFTVPTVQQTTPVVAGVQQTQGVGTIQIAVPRNAFAGNDTVTLTLPHGFHLPAGANNGFDIDAGSKDASTSKNFLSITKGLTVTGTDIAVKPLSDTQVQITMPAATALSYTDDVNLTVALGALVTTGANNGPQSVTFDSPGNSAFPSGSVTVANVQSSGMVDLAATDTQTGSNIFNFALNLKEEVANSVKQDGNSIKLKLPSGYKWDAAPAAAATVLYGKTAAGAMADTNVKYNVIGDDTLYINFDKATTEAASVRIPLQFEVKDDTQVKPGDVNVYVSGTSTANVGSFKVGSYGDYSASISAASTPAILASHANQQIGDIIIKESVPGTFVNGRTIELNLPDGARWEDEFETLITNKTLPGNPAINMTFQNGVHATAQFTGTDYRTLKLVIDQQSSGTDAGEIDLKNVYVATSARLSGDLNIAVSGSTGVTGNVKVATVKAPGTITASATPNVVGGLNNQPMGDLTVVEAVPGAFTKDAVAGVTNDGSVKISIDNTGVLWDKTPTVTVADGDARITNVFTSGADLFFTIDSASGAKAATFTITGGTLKVDNSAAAGPVKFKLRGQAVSYAANKVTTWANDTTTVSSVAAATINGTSSNPVNSAKFVIGKTDYTVNGATKTTDAAPFVDAAGRTQLPLRAVAESLGATVGWDQDTQTASILLNGKAVSVAVGSNKLNVAGVNVIMDTVAVNKDSRVFVPFRAIAEALGAKVAWDETTQTVTLN